MLPREKARRPRRSWRLSLFFFVFLTYFTLRPLWLLNRQLYSPYSYDESQKINFFESGRSEDFFAVEGQLLSLKEARKFSEEAYSAYEQEQLIDPAVEAERCKRNGYTYGGRKKRRRIFWGSLIAADSWQVIHAHAAEAYGIYHTAALVESNSTQMLYKRDVRFGPASQNLKRLTESGIFGPDTKVIVDYYYDGKDPPSDGLDREHMQRQSILERWQKNGMRVDDIGFLSDVDEVFTRDFLRALQICNVPQFEPGQDCRESKVYASTLIFESSPECIWAHRRWFHPEVIIGECVDLIGNDTIHKPPLRVWKGKHSLREVGHGGRSPEDCEDYSNYTKMYANETITYNNKTMYPLLNGADFRELRCGVKQFAIHNDTHVHTAFHLHNFFESTDEVRNKYLTYGHPIHNALTRPFARLHPDLNFTVRCALDLEAKENFPDRLAGGLNSVVGPIPIFFQNGEYRKKRHDQLRKMIEEDERRIQNSTESTS